MRLSELLPKLSTSEREKLAAKMDVSVGYLWQLSTRWRGKRPSINLIVRLAAADKRLSVPELVKEFSDAKQKEKA